MQDWDAYYRAYQTELAERFLIPILRRWRVEPEGRSVLEVGCGDGGVAAAFERQGSRVVMMDVEERLIQAARSANDREGIRAKTFVGDVFDRDAAFYREGPFDLVMFRDVMEHLERPATALDIVKRSLSPRGRVFVVFPPYFSPYGAHQQILPRKSALGIPYNKLPFLQLLPKDLFLRLVRGDHPANREVARLRGVALTVDKFERCVAQSGYEVERRKMFLSRPSFALRYGIPVAGASFVGRIPLVREIAVTAAYYLLRPKLRDIT